MGDAQGQSGLEPIVFFLDENHCGNRHLHAAFEAAGIRYEKHTDHFKRGTEDLVWIPSVAVRGWAVLTADTRIRHNYLERRAVVEHGLSLFYFSRNDFAGSEMGVILRAALPKMIRVIRSQPPPFAVSISRSGEVNLREEFHELSDKP